MKRRNTNTASEAASTALVLVPRTRRTRGQQYGTSTDTGKRKRSRITYAGANPTGRVDIALSRLLNVAVMNLADAPLKGVYIAARPLIDDALRAVVGPRTLTGTVAQVAVTTLQEIARAARIEQLRKQAYYTSGGAADGAYAAGARAGYDDDGDGGTA